MATQAEVDEYRLKWPGSTITGRYPGEVDTKRMSWVCLSCSSEESVTISDREQDCIPEINRVEGNGIAHRLETGHQIEFTLSRTRVYRTEE